MERNARWGAIVASGSLALTLSGPCPAASADPGVPPARVAASGDASPKGDAPAAPTTDKSATDKAATDKAATDKAATDKAATDKAATDKAATDKAATDKAATDKAAKPDAHPPVDRAGAHATSAPGAASGKAAPKGATAAHGATRRAPAKPPQPPKKDLAKLLGPLPHKRVAMDFRGMDVDNVLLMFSTWAGVTIVKDPGLSGNINLIQGQEVPLLDAFKILEAVLNQKGFTIERDGPVLRVAPKAPSGPPPGPPPGPPAPEPPKPPAAPDEEKITMIFPLQYASAQGVARVINDLFGSGGGGGGQPGGPGGPGGPPPGQPGGPPPGAPAGAGKVSSKKAAQVKATADFDTNQVIATGDPILMDDVEKVIKQLDRKVDIPLETKSWEIKYAEVNDVATQVAALLTSVSGTGRTSAFQDIPFERRVLGGGGGGGYNPYGQSNTGPVTAANGRVISDPRTNTLTVTATKEQLAQIDKIVEALDKKVDYASTTFVLPLKHVEASLATFILGQLFQKQNNNNDFFGFFGFGGGNNQQNQVRQRRRLGDPQSPRPSTGSRNSNPFGFASDPSGGPSGDGSGGASAASIVAPRGPSAASLATGGPQAAAPTVQSGDAPGSAFPIPTSVTLDGPQLAQWWNNQQNQDTTKTGRDESGRVRPLVDLQGKVQIVPDLNSNALIVNTNPSNLEALKQVLALIDKQPAQVLIEGIIVEASLDDTTKLGMSLSWTESPAFGSKVAAQQTTVNLPTSDSTGGLTFHALGGSFDALLKAVRTDSRFNILSTPRILTLNNQQAAILIGQQVPILNSTQSFNGTSNNITFKDVGVTLDVTPHITADGYVTVEVGEDADEVSGFTTLSGNQVPLIARRSTETTIAMRDGQTIVLGGLIRNDVQSSSTRIPLLGDIPLIGGLFRSKEKTRSKTELMLFMRARIVQYDDEIDDLTTQQGAEAGIKPNSAAGKHLELPTTSHGAPVPAPPVDPKQHGSTGVPPVGEGPL